MLYVLLPPAYKTEFYFRLVIKHIYEFGGFRSAYSVASWGAYGQTGIAPTDATSANAIAAFVEDALGPPDTIDVENGTIIPMADGATGE